MHSRSTVETDIQSTHVDHPIDLRAKRGANRITTRIGAVLLAAVFTALGAGCANDLASSSDLALTAPTLGTAQGFAVLANAAVTCTDATITGDVGTLLAPPTGSFTETSCLHTGTAGVGDAVAIAAYDDSLTAYDALEAQPCDRVLTGTLAGVTLAPGVYCFDAAATLTGTLTLAGPATATWLFKIGTIGTGALTATGLTVLMAGGASPCNVTWWVAQAATLTDSTFVGTITAGAAITLTRGTLEGRTFAQNDVTITGTALTGCTDGSLGGEDDCERGDRACGPCGSGHGRHHPRWRAPPRNGRHGRGHHGHR